MTPIFDQSTQHVGWCRDGKVFDLDLNWVAFHRGGHLFSARDLAWLGPFVEGSLIDRGGQVVAWLAGSVPNGVDQPRPPPLPARPMSPLRPVRPIAPRRPLFPRFPKRGWSALSWERWLGGCDTTSAGALDDGGSQEDVGQSR